MPERRVVDTWPTALHVCPAAGGKVVTLRFKSGRDGATVECAGCGLVSEYRRPTAAPMTGTEPGGGRSHW